MLVRRSFIVLGLATLGMFLGVVASSAQDQLINNEQLKAFENNRSEFRKLIDGSKKPTAADKALIDTAARYYVHRPTLSAERNDPNAMNLVHITLKRDLIEPILNPNAFKQNLEFRNQLGPALVSSFQQVFKEDILDRFKDNRLVQTNVAMMLPQVAKLKQDNVGTYLAEFARDPSKHDALRIYAVKGLKEYLPASTFIKLRDAEFPPRVTRKKQEIEYVNALVEYVEGKNPSKVSYEHDADVARYLRREALDSLSSVGVPLISFPNPKTPEGLVVPTLLKVISKKGGLQPEPGLSEKIEAAIGLCSMKYADIIEYKPDASIYLIGRLIEEFGSEYAKDWSAFSPKGSKQPKIYWKLDAKRLELALNELAQNAKLALIDQTDQESAKRAVENSKSLLDKAKTYFLTPIAQYQQVDNPTIRAFQQEVDKMRPKDGILFRNAKEIQVDLQ